MTGSKVLLPGAACLALWPPGLSAAQEPDGGAAKYAKAIKAVYPALVRIKVVTPLFHGGREVRVQESGSGVIFSPKGYVVTNHHVAGRATSLVCVLSNKEEIRAKRIGTDPLSDICVIQLTEKRVYPHATFGDSGKLKVGDTVLAMGSPGSISQSVTAGVVSNVDLILPSFYGRFQLDGEAVGSLVKWIAHDAAIFPGNSGGPLVDLEGRIVGINELGMGLAAAIPANLVQRATEAIIRDGEPRRSRLGVVIQPLLKSSGRDKGVLVSGVIPGSPAEKSGLRPGDILLSYNGHPVTARFGEDLPLFNRLVFATPVGAKVQVVVDRGGKRKTLTVQTGLRTKALADNQEIKEWGMAARDLTETVVKNMKRDSTDGVLVSSTRPGGPCSDAQPEIRGGDILIAVDGRPVKDVKALIAATARIVKGQNDPVPTLVAFERKHARWLTLVKVGIKELRDRSPEARKAWFPASVQVLTTDLAEALKLKGKTGVRLTSVFERRSAAEAGLKVGDILTRIDGEAIRASRPEDADVFPTMVRQRRVGHVATFTVIRDGRQMTVACKLERSPKATREMKRYRDVQFGFTVRDVSDEDRRTEKIAESLRGVLVTAVEPGSLAAVGNLRVSDIVLSVDGKATERASEMKKVMEAVHGAKPPRTVFFVQPGIYTMYVEIDTPWLVTK